MLGSEWTKELILLGLGLVFTVTVLGGGIDELEFDLMGMPRGGWVQKRLSNSDLSLSWTHHATLKE